MLLAAALQGVLSMSRRVRYEATVRIGGVGKLPGAPGAQHVVISGKANLNRAMHGDTVAGARGGRAVHAVKEKSKGEGVRERLIDCVSNFQSAAPPPARLVWRTGVGTELRPEPSWLLHILCPLPSLWMRPRRLTGIAPFEEAGGG